jgi:DNA-binding transcriptional MocR family regulator
VTRWIKLGVLIRERLAELRGAKLAVYICLGSHINEAGECFMSSNKLAAETGYSRRQVIRAVQELCALGLVDGIEQGGWRDKKPWANRFRVNHYVAYGEDNPGEVGDTHGTHIGNVTNLVTNPAMSPTQNVSKMSPQEELKQEQVEPCKERAVPAPWKSSEDLSTERHPKRRYAPISRRDGYSDEQADAAKKAAIGVFLNG